jgi:hypothetical protein
MISGMISIYLLPVMALGGCLYLVWRGSRRWRAHIWPLVASAALAMLVVLGFLLAQTVLQVLVTALLIGMALGAFQGSTWANRAHRYLPMLRVSVLVERSLFHRLLLPSPRRDRPRGKGASVKRAALGLCAVLIAVVQSGMLVGRGVALLVQLMAARRRSPRNLDRLSASIPAISVTACRGVVRNCRGSKRRRIERSQSMSRCLHGACSQAVMLG